MQAHAPIRITVIGQQYPQHERLLYRNNFVINTATMTAAQRIAFITNIEGQGAHKAGLFLLKEIKAERDHLADAYELDDLTIARLALLGNDALGAAQHLQIPPNMKSIIRKEREELRKLAHGRHPK